MESEAITHTWVDNATAEESATVEPATEACRGGLCSRQHRLTMGLIVGLYATVGLISLGTPVASQHAARRVTSGRSCASLRKDAGGWPARASTSVCSDVPSLGAGPRPWSSARKVCEKAGARLCSAAEVAAGVLRGTGIDSANASAAWTGTSCGSGASYLAMRHASSSELSDLLREFDNGADTLASRLRALAARLPAYRRVAPAPRPVPLRVRLLRSARLGARRRVGLPHAAAHGREARGEDQAGAG